jgi:hypothetical protein
MIVTALPSPIERRCLVYDAGKPAVVSSIFLSNNGEAFAAVAWITTAGDVFSNYISMLTTLHYHPIITISTILSYKGKKWA